MPTSPNPAKWLMGQMTQFALANLPDKRQFVRAAIRYALVSAVLKGGRLTGAFSDIGSEPQGVVSIVCTCAVSCVTPSVDHLPPALP